MSIPGRQFWSSRRMRQCAQLIGLLTLAGCGTLNYTAFPDRVRTKQANILETDFKAVDLAAVKAAIPAQLKAQQDAMHAVQDSFSAIHTRAVIATFVDHPLDEWTNAEVPNTPGYQRTPSGLRARAQDQLAELTRRADGIPFPNPDQLAKDLGQYDAQVNGRETYFRMVGQVIYTTFHLGSMPGCEDVPGQVAGHYGDRVNTALAAIANPKDLKRVKEFLEHARTDCAAAPPSLDAIYNGQNLIAQAHKRLLAAQAQRKRDGDAAEAQLLIVNQARKDYNDAVAKTGTTTPNADSVRVAANQLVAAIQVLQGLSQKTARADVLLAKLNLSAASTQLGDISSGVGTGQLPDGTKDLSAAIILAARLMDAQHGIDTAIERSQQIPPQLVLAQESLQLEQAQAVVSAQDRRIELLQQIEDTLWDEFRHLVGSLKQIDIAYQGAKLAAGRGPLAKVIPSNAADCNPADRIPADMSKQTYEQMFCVNPVKVREALLVAAVDYVAAQGRLEAQRNKLEYDLVDLDDQLSVTYSIINLERWQALLEPTVSEVVTFNTLDSNTVALAAQLMQVLGLVYIGHGVNK